MSQSDTGPSFPAASSIANPSNSPDNANGQVIVEFKDRRRHQDYLCFLKHVDDKRWLAIDNNRWRVHYAPPYSSWLNKVEIWFNLITQKAIRRGTFSRVKELVRNVADSIPSYNRHPNPFIWTATADSILAKIERLSQAISETRH